MAFLQLISRVAGSWGASDFSEDTVGLTGQQASCGGVSPGPVSALLHLAAFQSLWWDMWSQNKCRVLPASWGEAAAGAYEAACARRLAWLAVGVDRPPSLPVS